MRQQSSQFRKVQIMNNIIINDTKPNGQTFAQSAAALQWGWTLSDFATRKMLYNASVYVHNNEFDAQRQKVIRLLLEFGDGSMLHGELLRRMHIDSDAFRKVINTMLESEELTAQPVEKGGLLYTLSV